MDTLSINMAQPVTNVLTPRTVLVQSPGMAQWLNIRLAEKLGISANIAFPLPSSFIWTLYQAHIPNVATESAFTKANMTWKLMALLPSYVHQPAFKVLNDYLTEADTALHGIGLTQHISQTKLYQLASKIADAFDQYLVYRADWIQTWESGQQVFHESNTAASYELWQATLWRALVGYTSELGESPEHRASLHSQLLNRLSRHTTTHLAPIHVFGISAMPEQQLEVLQAYSQTNEVFIYWLNPCAHYWADLVTEQQRTKLALAVNEGRLPQSAAEYVEVGHPLLSAWGALGRHYQDRLLGVIDTQTDTFSIFTPSNLLEAIQQSILTLESDPLHRATDCDSSIQFHVCHSKYRELEVLHDQLLSFLDSRPDLEPKDIIVMMPNVAEYVPFIEGVFGAKQHNMRPLPFAISDKRLKDDKSIIEGFSQLISLHLSRVTVQEVSHLLHIPAVMNKFELSASDLESIITWLNEVQVKWGLSGTHKAQLGLPAYHTHSWLYGVLRLLTGYAMKAPIHSLVMASSNHEQGVSPYDYVEGQQSVVLGKLCQFITLLAQHLEQFTQTVSLVDKERQILSLIDDFFVPDDTSMWVVSDLKEQVQAVSLHQSHYPDNVEHSVYVSALMERIENKGVGQRFLAGAINFCTLMPMRSIPFKVVCLLGMNDKDYPRYVEPMSFDLIHQTAARKGDRSRRQDDRYLFLEALVCATQTFYVSYIGRSAKDNSALNPSLLVTELMDYCDTLLSNSALTAATLVTVHPLHPYHRSYFLAQADDTSQSYASQWLNVATSKKGVNSAPPFWRAEPVSAEPMEQLDITELCRFFANPCLGFFRAKWQTRFILSNGQDELEPMSLDGLARYYLIDELKAVEHQTESMDDAIDYLSANGRLPLGQIGQVSLIKSKMLANQYLTECQLLPAKHTRQEINLSIMQTRLLGWTDEVRGNELVMMRPGRLRVKDKIDLWIWWLALCANKQSCHGLSRARYIGLQETFEIPAIEPSDAIILLEALVLAYQNGQLNPLPFFPESGLVWLKSVDPLKTLNAFYGDENRPGEGQELHAKRLFPDLSEQFEPFVWATNTLLKPLFDVCGGKL